MSDRFWAGIQSTKWREGFSRLGIIVEKDCSILRGRKDILLLSHCSLIKGKDKSRPISFYLGKECQQMMHYAEDHDIPYGIISDRYAISYSDEILDMYDVSPRLVDPKEMGRRIGDRLAERGWRKVLYVRPSPMHARPYIRFLLYAGVEVHYTTSLKMTKRPKLGLMK